QPAVAVFSSGDELIDIFQESSSSCKPGRGQIFDANRVMLLTAIQDLGALSFDLGIARDSADSVNLKFESAFELNCDLLVVSGGVSEGERKCVRHYLEKSGEIHFNKVNIKPGKPMTLATISKGSKRFMVLALPGNPVSALVMFNAFAAPVIRTLVGLHHIS